MYSETEFSENFCPPRLDNLPAAELVVFRDQNGKDFVSYRLSKKKSQYIVTLHSICIYIVSF
jgi:hypothetical protein